MTAAFTDLRRREASSVFDEMPPAVRALVHEYDLPAVAAAQVRFSDPVEMRAALEAMRAA